MTSPELEAFRNALAAGDEPRVLALLDAHPSLVHARPFGEDWPVSAAELAATRCVFHRPGARAIVQALVERGAECGFQAAARAGLLDRVRALLAEDAALLDAVDEEDRTALFRATCVYGKFAEGEAVADFLLECDAELDLSSAATLGLVRAVEAALEIDPTVAQSVDAEGMTPLHWAVRPRRHRDGAVPITRLLLEGGADVHATNPTEEEMQAVHHVAEWCGELEQLDLLLEFGADVNARANRGWTPLDYARDRGREEMVAALQARGGVSGRS